MFSLFKNSFNHLWKGETNKPRISSDEVSEEGFVLVPNRKRSLVKNNGNLLNINDEPRIKKDSECSSVISESQENVEGSSVDTKNIEVEVTTCLNSSIAEDFSDVALEGVPFISSPHLLQVHDLLKDCPPLCPNLPQVTFDFTLERTVLDR